jgi:hypothetical protein
MNQDLVFDHVEAEKDLNVHFRPFHLKIEDVTRTKAA